jgi:hypothetical protein
MQQCKLAQKQLWLILSVLLKRQTVSKMGRPLLALKSPAAAGALYIVQVLSFRLIHPVEAEVAGNFNVQWTGPTRAVFEPPFTLQQQFPVDVRCANDVLLEVLPNFPGGNVEWWNCGYIPSSLSTLRVTDVQQLDLQAMREERGAHLTSTKALRALRRSLASWRDVAKTKAGKDLR